MKSKKSSKKRVAPAVRSSSRQQNSGILLSVAIIVAAGIFAYANSMQAPFIFDDLTNIVDNPTIRSLKNIGQVLNPPSGFGVGDRPVVNLTLAINYAISGEQVWSYHALNLIIHILAALSLFGIVRRTLLSEKFREAYAHMATPLALGSALIWMLHPIQTQAVTYIIQRCESLMGMFFLLTIYCAIRSWQSESMTRWRTLSIISFFLGVGSKEVIIMAPFIVLAYEWCFIRSSIREVLKRSWPLYAGYGAGIVILVMLVFSGGTFTRTAGATLPNPWHYWQTQPQVIFYYLRLAFWPAGLCFDYGWPIVSSLSKSLLWVIILGIILGVSAWLFVKRKILGFLAFCFFAILMPTSMIPLLEPAVEYRMYLPMISIVILLVFGFVYLVKVICQRLKTNADHCINSALAVFVLIICLILGYLTYNRNDIYRQGLIWNDTIHKSPGNSRAFMNLGAQLEQTGNHGEAIIYLKEAVRLKPDYAQAYNNLGNVLTAVGRFNEAIAVLRKSISLKPDYAEAYSNLGVALGSSGRLDEALLQFEKALSIKPHYAEAHSNLGLAMGRLGRFKEAEAHFLEALKLKPDYPQAKINLEILRKKSKSYSP